MQVGDRVIIPEGTEHLVVKVGSGEDKDGKPIEMVCVALDAQLGWYPASMLKAAAAPSAAKPAVTPVPPAEEASA